MQTKKNNSELKPYVEKFIIEKLENCELFVKTFGKGYAKERLRMNFKRLYTDATDEKCSGLYTFDAKSITLFYKGTDGNLLSYKDIENDYNIKSTVLHEGVHAVFNKNRREAKALKALNVSGIHHIFSNRHELGRGLNEGFTNWVCLRAGINTSSYRELTNIVNLLEIAVGEEKIMQFGKGDIKRGLPTLLNMPLEECVNLLSKCDSLYNYNDKASDYRIAAALLFKEIEDKKENPDDTKQPSNELNNNYLYRTLSKNSEYLEFAKSHNLDPNSDENKLEFLEQKYTFYKKQAKQAEIEVHSFIISKYFMKELDALLNKESCSFEEYIKYDNFSFLIRTNSETDNEIIKQFSEKRKLLMEKFEEKKMSEFKNSLENGEISVQELKVCNYLSGRNGRNQSTEFKTYVSEKLMPENPEVYKFFLDRLNLSASIEKVFDYNFLELETESGKKTNLFFDEKQGYHFTRNLKGNKTFQADEELENPEELFQMTMEFSQDFQKIVSNFMKLKDSISQKNPTAKIQIVNDVVLVTGNENEISYYVIEGNEFSLAQAKELIPETKKTIKIITPEEESKADSKKQPSITDAETNIAENSLTSLVPVSKNPFRMFFEKIKDKIIDVLSKNTKNAKESESETEKQENNDNVSSNSFSHRISHTEDGKIIKTPIIEKSAISSTGETEKRQDKEFIE